jgi:NitT/TauT family transport system substrate-binding protein
MKMRGLFACLALLVSLAATPALSQDRLLVAAQRIGGNGPLFYAVARNYFRDEGVVVELKFFAAAQQGANALATGQADLAAIELSAPVMNFAGAGAIKAIAGQAREKTNFEGNSLLASNGAAAGGLRDIKDLADRSLAIPQLGSVYHYQAAQLAAARGIDIKSVTFKPMQSVEAVSATLSAGQADAAILPADYARSLIAASQGKDVTWVSVVSEAQLGALFASPRSIETKRPVIEKFIRAYQRGANDYAAVLLTRSRFNKRVLNERSNEGAMAIAPFLYPNDSPQKAAALIEAAAPYADPQARLDVADFLKQFAWFKAQGLIDSSAEASKALDLTFVTSRQSAAQ